MAQHSSLDWQYDGHQRQKALLEKALLDNRLAHAYIFSGPGQGPLRLARRLAEFLLCQEKTGCGRCPQCRAAASGANADLLELSGSEPIKAEPVRELTYKLSLKPYSASHKVALIGSAHNLTAEAANALLKSIEEPKPNTLIILLTDNHNRLLPTIVSRAQRLAFGPEPGSAGEPEHLDRFLEGSLGQRLMLAAELSEMDSADAERLLQSWLVRLERLLSQNPTLPLAKRIQRVLKASRRLQQNANAKLLFAELMASDPPIKQKYV